MQVSRRTWREAARFPESGVLSLSLTTQHEEVMGRIASCMAAAIVQMGRNVRFPLPYPCYTTWALGKTVQVKFLMIDTITLTWTILGNVRLVLTRRSFHSFFVTWASAPHSSSNRQLARPWSTETKWSSRFVDELPTDWVNWTERLTPEVTCRSPKVAHFRRDLHTLLSIDVSVSVTLCMSILYSLFPLLTCPTTSLCCLR